MHRKPDHNLITLIGKEEDNFYELGKRDKNFFLDYYEHLTGSLQYFSLPTKTLFKKLGEQITPQLLKKHPSLKKNLTAYGEGLKAPLNKVAVTFFLPEILSSHNAFNPGIISTLLGCSSLFYSPPQSQGLCHFRVLDLPLNGYYAEHAQTILFSFPRQKVFFFTCQGMPYPSLTAMNESGLTLALHHQPSKFFNHKGVPVFELAKTIMAEARDRKDLENITKDHQSMSGWNLYSCIDKEVLNIQLAGKEKPIIKSHSLEEGETLYFGNEPRHNLADQKMQPYGFSHFNEMRKESLRSHLAKNHPLTQEKILKGLASPFRERGENDLAKWQHPPLSLHSVEVCMLDPAEESALKVEGPAPKTFPAPYTIYRHCLSSHATINPPKEEKKEKTPRQKLNLRGLNYFSQCTQAYRKKDIPKLFHTIQMAVECYQDQPEQSIARFYYLVMEYIFLTSMRDENSLLKRFEELHKKLPPYLEEQRKLFVLRLHKLLKIASPHELTLDNQFLRQVWEYENKLKPQILRAKRLLYVPRPEILDIIYPFS